jgi:hypothetical protein
MTSVVTFSSSGCSQNCDFQSDIASVPLSKAKRRSQVWCFMSIIPALRRLRQENHEFKVSLDYIVRPCPPPTKKKRNQRLCNYFNQ